MRPYQLTPAGEWLDLDTVQSIDPPRFVDEMGRGGYFVVMEWRHAFQSAPRTLRVGQDFDYTDGSTKPHMAADGVTPTMLHQVRVDVFEPFFRAWSGRRIEQPEMADTNPWPKEPS